MMEDRFKFRAYIKELKELLPVQYINPITRYVMCDREDGSQEFKSFNRVEIMQCTGLKDKNGKLIFEGDIVRLAGYSVDSTHVVKFGDFAMYDFDFQEDYEKGSTAVYGWYLGGKEYPIPLSISLDTSGLEIEVIGNIYENPELLEVGE